jgi:hypothetical protein
MTGDVAQKPTQLFPVFSSNIEERAELRNLRHSNAGLG